MGRLGDVSWLSKKCLQTRPSQSLNCDSIIFSQRCQQFLNPEPLPSIKRLYDLSVSQELQKYFHMVTAL